MKQLKVVMLLVCLGVLFNTPAFPGDPSGPPLGIVVETPGAPVEFDGKILFYARVSSKILNSKQRAQIVSERIHKLAHDPLFRPESITVHNADHGSDIMVGDLVILPIYDFLAKVEGKTAEELARDYAERIRQAIAAFQKVHSFRNLIIGIVETFVAFLVLVALIMLVNRGMRRLNRAILASDRIRSVKIGEFEFFTADRVKAVMTSTVKMIRLLIILVLLYSYFHLGLSFFPSTQRYALKLYESLFGAVAAVGEAIWDQTPALAFLAVLFFITRYVLKTLRFFFDQVSAGKVTVSGLDAEVAPITYRIVKITHPRLRGRDRLPLYSRLPVLGFQRHFHLPGRPVFPGLKFGHSQLDRRGQPDLHAVFPGW